MLFSESTENSRVGLEAFMPDCVVNIKSQDSENPVLQTYR